MNDWIEPLGGHPQAVTPHLKQLAARSVVFEQAYAAAPACAPSRTAALFGQAPWRTGIYTNRQGWAMAYKPGQQLSLVGQIKRAGWKTFGAGKVFHNVFSGLDLKDWTVFFRTHEDRYEPLSQIRKQGHVVENGDFGAISNDAPPMRDERLLEPLKRAMQPGAENCFWAFGCYRPHSPFIAPQRFFDMIETPVMEPPGRMGKPFDPYDETEIAHLPDPARRLIRKGIGKLVYNSGEYQTFLHSYLAAIAYADEMIGRLLDHLDACGLTQSTMIVFWSDHGFQLGEKLAFRKFTLWERALRVPFFIAAPGLAPARTKTPVSLLDIYPTLASVVGFEPPHVMDGQDLLPVLKGKAGRGHVVSIWEHHPKKSNEPGDIATTVRTEAHRLILYHDGSAELYDVAADPFETINLLDGDLGRAGNLDALVEDMCRHLPVSPAKPLLKASLPKQLETVRDRLPGFVTIPAPG